MPLKSSDSHLLPKVGLLKTMRLILATFAYGNSCSLLCSEMLRWRPNKV